MGRKHDNETQEGGLRLSACCRVLAQQRARRAQGSREHTTHTGGNARTIQQLLGTITSKQQSPKGNSRTGKHVSNIGVMTRSAIIACTRRQHQQTAANSSSSSSSSSSHKEVNVHARKQQQVEKLKGRRRTERNARYLRSGELCTRTQTQHTHRIGNPLTGGWWYPEPHAHNQSANSTLAEWYTEGAQTARHKRTRARALGETGDRGESKEG